MNNASWVHRVVAACILGFLVGCVADAGEPPDYSDHIGLVPPVDPTPIIEPDPYEPGEDRLAVGAFYEGGRSDTILLNGDTTNYFIFVIEGTMMLTYSQSTSTDRIEGVLSAELTLEGTPFWGGGIIWDEPIDISEWTTMFVGFKSSDPSFANFDVTLQYGEAETSPVGVALDPTDYGYTNDGEWHFLEIPLQDAIDAGFDPTVARSPFIVGGRGNTAGDQLLVDDLYFTKD